MSTDPLFTQTLSLADPSALTNHADWIGVIGLLIGVVSLAYAWWQNRSRKRLENYIRAQNWWLYTKASKTLGTVQLAQKTYKALAKAAQDPDVIEQLARSDDCAEEVLGEVVRTIHYSEPTFDDATIARWRRERRIPSDNHLFLFRPFLPANKRMQPVPPSDSPNGQH